ncbi:transcription elongation factor GreA [Candidatus Microgenomates bacterium]|nr:MAG: transcription elongation factor GreA [Candidatus Microgenomates bacterium]
MKKFVVKKAPIKNVFTKEGFENLKIEYKTILDSRKEAIEAVSRARELGDLSENGFYKSAKAKLSSIHFNLRRLNFLIKNALVAEKPLTGIVGVTSKVTISDGENFKNYTIVGKYESDPFENKISNESPIGKALIGKREGESFKVATPKGEVIYKIIKIIS